MVRKKATPPSPLPWTRLRVFFSLPCYATSNMDAQTLCQWSSPCGSMFVGLEALFFPMHNPSVATPPSEETNLSRRMHRGNAQMEVSWFHVDPTTWLRCSSSYSFKPQKRGVNSGTLMKSHTQISPLGPKEHVQRGRRPIFLETIGLENSTFCRLGYAGCKWSPRRHRPFSLHVGLSVWRDIYMPTFVTFCLFGLPSFFFSTSHKVT